MDNNVDAILGITTTENSQVPFIVNLINTLKDNQLISEGITIPFLIGAYKIQENDTTIPTLDYLKSTLQKIINSLGEYKLFIKTCSNINQYVISIIGDKDIDIIGNDAPYPYIVDNRGCKVLFFEEYFDIQVPSIENISVFFWAKYKDDLQAEKYSYIEREWQSFLPEEKTVINGAVQHSPLDNTFILSPAHNKQSSKRNSIVILYYIWLFINLIFFLLSIIEGEDLEYQIKRLFPFNGIIDYYDITELLLYCAALPLIILGTYVGLNKLMRQAEKIHREK
ncbi:hypothetical protein [uncultured Parabacteroides sp.]|jgi:hypothetical protein|uniref:hypothetical protein n=1 Tax=uncultured Parabacteroides sp. TaxID=512312 RepID=UPI0025DEE643|nr:hypothetical protein [uncultured Parabacteroides sp.]